MVFRLFWILTRKTCVFAGKFLAGLSKILSACPVEHLQIKFSELKSWKLEEFRKFFEVFGTMAEKFFRVGKTAIDVRGNSLWKIFSKEKISLFFRLWANVYFQRKFLPELRNPQSMYRWKFLGKNSFWNIYNFSHFFRTLIQKTLSRKEIFFPGCHNCNPRVQRHFLRKSTFHKKKFCSFICSGVWAIFFVYWQKLVRVSKKQPTKTEKKIGRKELWKIFFFQIIFGFRAEKFEQLDKKYSQDCQNSIQSLQRNIFRTFLWNEETLLKVFNRWANLLNFGVFFLSNISKLQPTGAAERFEALLERRVILWSFLVSERK